MDTLIESEIGSRGPWLGAAILGGCFTTILAAFVTFLPSFTTYLPEKYRCLVPECELVSSSDYNASFAPYAIPDWGGKEESIARSCNRYSYVSGPCDDPRSFSDQDVPCTEHVFDRSPYRNSFVMEYDLPPCLEAPNGWPLYPIVSEVQLLGLSFMVGLLIGAVSTGIASDAFGRKKTLFGCVLLDSLFVLGGYWTGSIWAYVVLRLLCGIVTVALFTNCFLILVEMVSPKDRDLFGIIMNIPFASGQMILSLMAYLLQDWRDLHLVVGILGLASLASWPLIPESPRWLLSVGRRKEAVAVLQKGAKMNGKIIRQSALEALKEPPGSEWKKATLRDLLKNKTVIKIALIMFYNWFSTVSVYYGLSLISVNLGGDMYINFFLSGLVEIPSFVFTALLIGRIGRQFLFSFSSLACGLACMSAGLLDDPILTTALAIGGKLFASTCFTILYLYTAELFPTEIRNSVLGMASLWGRLGGITAPFIASVGSLIPELPFLIMGSFGVLGGLLGLALPETIGAKLPEQIDDINILVKNVSPVRKFFCGAKKESSEDELICEVVTIEKHPHNPRTIAHVPMDTKDVMVDPANWGQNNNSLIINKALEVSDIANKADSELGKSTDSNNEGGQPIVVNENTVAQNNAQNHPNYPFRDPIMDSSSYNPEDKNLQPSRVSNTSNAKHPSKASIDSLSSILKEEDRQTSPVYGATEEGLVLSKGGSHKFSQLNDSTAPTPTGTLS